MKTEHGEIIAGDPSTAAIIACGLTHADMGTAPMLGTLYVNPSERGQGHGTDMLQTFLGDMRKLGNKYVLIQAWPLDDRKNVVSEDDESFPTKQARLRRFYERHGFVDVGSDEYFMLLKL